MKKRLLCLAILSMTALISCDKEMDSERNNSVVSTKSKDFDRFFTNKKDIDKKMFSKALVSSLNQSVLLRTLIKEEALKEFNNDTEVLFVLIKDMPLENGTVFELVGNNIEGGKQKLQDIITNDPELTILVPTLPEESFSAEIWDVNGEVPSVAIRLDITNDVPIVWNSGEVEVIPAAEIPGFPVLVVKDNERLISRTNTPNFDDINTNIAYQENGIVLKFMDDEFDAKVKPKSYMYSSFKRVDERLIKADSIYKGKDGWERDYIYYGIDGDGPGDTHDGPMSFDFKESIGDFGMEGDPWTAYSLVSDQIGDPNVNPDLGSGDWNHWTDNQYEFKVKILINSSQGAGAETVRILPIRPDDLFELTYQRHVRNFLWWSKTTYTLEDISCKYMYVNKHVITWDLQNKSAEWKFIIEEVDIPTTTVIQESNTAKIATNFSLDDVKLGIKFGVSGEASNTQTITRTYTQGNDELGDQIVSFGEDVIIGQRTTWLFGTRYRFKQYSTGAVRFTLEPRRTQE
ncbi:hypothetical protein ACX0HA_05065 [Flavobacterium hauense]